MAVDSNTTKKPKFEGTRVIMVANHLPLESHKDDKTGKWSFSWNQNSLLLQMKDGIYSESMVIYVGTLMVDIDASEREEVTQKLWHDYNCIPTFLDPDLSYKFYHGFCKGQLWPIFHYSLPLTSKDGDIFERSLFNAYVSANDLFAEKIVEIINPDADYIWVHDYHLMLLPLLLRKKLIQVKIGFFLYSPFPSSEIYKALPVRDELLRGLLNADVIGFHTFDYARHFLSCCSRLLGHDHELKHGCIGINYHGRVVKIKVLPVGVHVSRIRSVMNDPLTISKVQEIEEKFKEKTLFLGVDYMEAFKGIGPKLEALEILLERNLELRGKLVFVQIANPACSTRKGVIEASAEATSIVERINQKYGHKGYEPVVFIENSIPFYEKLAYYVAAECCIVNSLREGMNLIPYEYVVAREEAKKKTSTLIISEFVGCSLSLSGIFRVNPWDVDAVSEAMIQAAVMHVSQKRNRHKKHYDYVNSHQLTYWASGFAQEIKKSSEDNYNRKCCTLGSGLDAKVVALLPDFDELSTDETVSYYKSSKSRVIFLDYDGTIVPETAKDKSPSDEIVAILNNLCQDPKNTVFIVSGRDRRSLGDWFSHCEKLGIAAEHGYFIRWSKDLDWETASQNIIGSDWRELAEPVMEVYTETTLDSFIESKESALVWHHPDSDVESGTSQAKELLDHLEGVLVKEPAVVKRGRHIVEVKTPGVSKGLTVEKILRSLIDRQKTPDFLLCIGDDRSDEDMFESIERMTSNVGLFPSTPNVVSCTVGEKPSTAKHYVKDTNAVIDLLRSIAGSV